MSSVLCVKIAVSNHEDRTKTKMFSSYIIYSGSKFINLFTPILGPG